MVTEVPAQRATLKVYKVQFHGDKAETVEAHFWTERGESEFISFQCYTDSEKTEEVFVAKRAEVLWIRVEEVDIG